MAEAVNTAASAVRDEVAIDLCSHEVDIQRTESKASKMMKSCSTSSLSEHHVTSCATQPIAINAYQREPDRSKTEMCSTADAVPDGVCERDVETIARLEALEERSNDDIARTVETALETTINNASGGLRRGSTHSIDNYSRVSSPLVAISPTHARQQSETMNVANKERQHRRSSATSGLQIMDDNSSRSDPLPDSASCLSGHSCSSGDTLSLDSTSMLTEDSRHLLHITPVFRRTSDGALDFGDTVVDHVHDTGASSVDHPNVEMPKTVQTFAAPEAPVKVQGSQGGIKKKLTTMRIFQTLKRKETGSADKAMAPYLSKVFGDTLRRNSGYSAPQKPAMYEEALQSIRNDEGQDYYGDGTLFITRPREGETGTKVIAGTRERIIEWMVVQCDTELRDLLLLTARHVFQPLSRMLCMIQEVLIMTPLPTGQDDDHNFRPFNFVLGFLKSWMTEFWFDFHDNEEAVRIVNEIYEEAYGRYPKIFANKAKHYVDTATLRANWEQEMAQTTELREANAKAAAEDSARATELLEQLRRIYPSAGGSCTPDISQLTIDSPDNVSMTNSLDSNQILDDKSNIPTSNDDTRTGGPINTSLKDEPQLVQAVPIPSRASVGANDMPNGEQHSTSTRQRSRVQNKNKTGLAGILGRRQNSKHQFILDAALDTSAKSTLNTQSTSALVTNTAAETIAQRRRASQPNIGLPNQSLPEHPGLGSHSFDTFGGTEVTRSPSKIVGRKSSGLATRRGSEASGLGSPQQSPSQMSGFSLRSNDSQDSQGFYEWEGLDAGSFALLKNTSAVIAQQLMCHDLQLFLKISRVAVMMQLWDCKNPALPTITRHLDAYINWCNKLAYWVSTIITSIPRLKDRVRMIEKFVHIATHCRALGSYNVMFAVYSGISNGAVSRMEKTMKAIAPMEFHKLKKIEALVNPAHNHSEYRLALKHSTQAIPAISVILKDFTMANENQKGDYLVNLYKLRAVHARINVMEGFQKSAISPEPDECLQDVIRRLRNDPEDVCYIRSKIYEPKVIVTKIQK